MSQINLESSDTITIHSSIGREKIQKNKIVCCRNYSVGTLVYLKNNAHLLMKESINELQSILDSDEFFKIDKAKLINIRYIEAIFPKKVAMKNGEEFFINPVRKKQLFKKIENYYVLE